MKVEGQDVVFTVSLWAVPINVWDRKEGGPTHDVVPFLKGQPWQDEAVLLETHEVVVGCATHTDLQQRTVEKLLQLKQDVMTNAVADVQKYDNRVQELQALTYKG